MNRWCLSQESNKSIISFFLPSFQMCLKQKNAYIVLHTYVYDKKSKKKTSHTKKKKKKLQCPSGNDRTFVKDRMEMTAMYRQG